MRILKALILAIIFSLQGSLFGQQTVGIFENSPEAFNGYTLFAPMVSNTTYLIDNCGEKVHSWNSDYFPGLAVYLMENGNLLRAGNVLNPDFNAGGRGGVLEMYNWNDSLIWSYSISTDTFCQHHDMEIMPNGNILTIVWEQHSKAEAQALGRVTSGDYLWSEKIIEIEPDYVGGGGTVVWEWNVWDHLMQDVDSTKPNYGVVSDSPELVNINYAPDSITSDWLHINSVDYHEGFDQIMLCTPNLGELWVIDHSTTSAEAAGHTGGNSGKGGDLLYRWGNPQAYDQGGSADQELFKHHHANWIPDSMLDGGKIMIFNNQVGLPDYYSHVNVIDPPVDGSGNYSYSGGAFLPDTIFWTYEADTPTDFFSNNVSGANRLPNGNTLICAGGAGRFFEVTPVGEVVWDYINPVSTYGILPQGSTPTLNNVFRCLKYPVDFPGFTGKTLDPEGFLESGSTISCSIYASTDPSIPEPDIQVFPNPATSSFNIGNPKNELIQIEILDLQGRKLVHYDPSRAGSMQIDTREWSNGVYLIRILTEREDHDQKS